MSMCDDEDFIVPGYCPACGNSRLQLRGGELLCEHYGCPMPEAAAKILADPEIHHIVRFDAEGYFNAKHPLRERVDSDLLDCKIFEVVMEWIGVPTMVRKQEIAGTSWRIKRASDDNLDADWIWERL